MLENFKEISKTIFFLFGLLLVAGIVAKPVIDFLFWWYGAN